MGYTNTNVQIKNAPSVLSGSSGSPENYDYYRNHKNPADTGGKYLIHIYTLGKFEVYAKDSVITEDSKRAVRMWNLFKYLLANRRKMLSTGELIDVLWGEDYSCENPEKALQNLIYRLRQTLSANGLKADDLILFTQGCYKWNENFPVWLDCDVLSEYCSKGTELAKNSLHNLHEARHCFEKAIELYNGDFLNEIIYDMWILPQRTSYKKIYTNCVTQLLEILHEIKDSEAIMRICNHYFNYEYLDESTNIYFLNALIAMNKKQEAQKHYMQVTKLMQKELGVKPSYEFTEIYKKIEAIAYKSNIENKNIDISVVNDILWKDERLSGAFKCDKETFISISKVMLRNLERSGMSIMMVLATFCKNTGVKNKSGFNNLNNNDDIDNILEIVEEASDRFAKAFRRGDIICVWNPYQALVMLTNLTFNDAEIAMMRIKDKIKQEILRDKYDITYTIVPLVHEIT